MKKWKDWPSYLKNEEVKLFYNVLRKKKFYRLVKRLFDIVASLILIVILFIPSLLVLIIITFTSRGSPIFRQQRIGRYGKVFTILKFRTMKVGSENGQQVTSKNDNRITTFGKFLRKTHIDEFPQLLNVLVGQMSFVGTRPEVPLFLKYYKPAWLATLLTRPGITSTSAVANTNESEKISSCTDTNEYYVKELLPKKMEMNLSDLSLCSFGNDFKIMWRTVF